LFLQLLYVAFDTVSAVKVKKKINNLLEINNVFLGLKKGGQVRRKKLCLKKKAKCNVSLN
jgi:hypothetical protein